MSNNLEHREVTLEHGQKTVNDYIPVSQAMCVYLYFTAFVLLLHLLGKMVCCCHSLFGSNRGCRCAPPPVTQIIDFGEESSKAKNNDYYR